MNHKYSQLNWVWLTVELWHRIKIACNGVKFQITIYSVALVNDPFIVASIYSDSYVQEAIKTPGFPNFKSALRSGNIITNEGFPRCDYC